MDDGNVLIYRDYVVSTLKGIFNTIIRQFLICEGSRWKKCDKIQYIRKVVTRFFNHNNGNNQRLATRMFNGLLLIKLVRFKWITLEL